jgi:hypothetical protein
MFDSGIRAIKVSLGATCLITGAIAHAGEPALRFEDSVTPEMRATATQAVTGLLASRQALSKGTFQASGEVTHTYRDHPEESYSGPIEVSSAFDFEKGLIRFDRTEQTRITFHRGPGPARPDDPGEKKQVVIHSKYALNAEKCINWNSHSSREVRVAARDHRTRSRAPGGGVFDVRTIGFPVSNAFQPHVPLESKLEGLWSQPLSVEKADSGRVKLERTFPETRGTRTLWIDPAQGFCPVYVGSRVKDERDESIVEASTTWQSRNDIWVPMETRWTSFYSGRDGRVQTEHKLKFRWEQVGVEPDPKQFTVESFLTEPGMRVSEIKF